jgi:hypothetical protein
VKEVAPAQLFHLQSDLATASASGPTSLAAARRTLDRLAASAAEMLGSLDADPTSQANWWARALLQQCRDALDELTFLAPWISQPAFPDRFTDLHNIDKIPTLRELAGLTVELLPTIEDRLRLDATSEERKWWGDLHPLITEATRRARSRIEVIERLARQSGELGRYGI